MKISTLLKKTKTVLAVAAIVATSNTIAQNNLFEEFKKYENEEFVQYRFHYSSTDKIMKYNDKSGDNKFKRQVIFTQVNDANHPMRLDIQDKAESNTPKEYKTHFRGHIYDHYSEMAYYRFDYRGSSTYLMVDGLIFSIDDCNDDMTSIGEKGYVYVPVSMVGRAKETPKKEEGKKLSMKEKMKAKLAEAKTSFVGTVIPECLKAISTKEAYKEKITTYIAAMKVKQAKTPLTAEDNKAIAAMKAGGQAEKDHVKKVNADYWNSEEGQRILNKGKADYLHLVNNSGGTINTIDEDGITSFFGPGRTNHYKCSKKVYYCTDCNSGGSPKAGAYIGGGNSSYCGKTITLTK